MPEVSILMPFLNVETFLDSSIRAVRAQTHRDWELILVDDGSSDGSRIIAEKHAAEDPRIRLLINPLNMGISRSCNRALETADGAWIARCDSDDLALPRRFELQLAAARMHPDIGIWGGHIFEQGPDSMRFFVRETDPDQAAIATLFHIPIINQTFMCRRAVVEQHGSFYDPAAKFEDYAFLAEVVGKTRLNNIPEPVMRVRKHATSYTAPLTPADNSHFNIRYQGRLLERMGLKASTDDLELHRIVVNYYHRARRERNYHDLSPLPQRAHVADWFSRICTANSKSGLLDRLTLQNRLDAITFWFPEAPETEP